jgi:hypothetical protein
MGKLIFQISLSFFVPTAIIVASMACHKPQADSNTANTKEASNQSSPKASPLTGFEKDLQFIRNGQYTYIYVFARKDQKVLDKDDGDYLRKNAPQVVDWVRTDEGKKVIAGTNFNLEEGNLTLLKKRFVVEDYSGK